MIRRGLLAVAIMLAISARAKAYTLQEVMTHLEQNEKSTSSLRFEFTQDVNFLANGMTSQVKGSAVFGKMGKFRILKSHPDQQLTVSNGKKIWVYTPAYKQVAQGSVKNWVNGSILPQGLIPLENYSKDLQNNFQLSLRGSLEEAGIEAIYLVAEPKNRDLGYSLELFISTKSWLPLRTIYLSDTAKIATRFAKLEINPALPNKTFQFTPPAGTEVVEMN